MIPEDPLENQLRNLGLTLDEPTLGALQRYIDILEHWNRSMNLTALEGVALARFLVAEPLWVAAQLAPCGRYIDIGSGNGSPAIPWLLAREFVHTDLVESRRRRAVFLRQLVGQLDLAAVQVHPMRFNEFLAEKSGPSGTADWVTLQGVRFTPGLRDEILYVCGPDTRIVWLTRDPDPPMMPIETLKIPGSDRSALVFQA